MNIRRSILPVVVLLLAIASRSFAEGNTPYSGTEWGLLDERGVMAAATTVTHIAYPDSDRAIVDERIVYDYRSDGTGEYQDESFAKILTEKGKEDARTIVLGFMLPYSRVDIAKLEVIGPAGEARAIDVAADSEETIDDRQMDENIYDPNARLLKVSIPNLEVGDVVHSVTRETTDRPIMPGQASDEDLFEGQAYIRHLSYELRAPKARPIVSKVLRAEIPGKIQYSERWEPDGGSVMRWEVSDVPRAFEEPGQPPEIETLQRLFVSTTGSWRDVSKWYWDLSRPHLEADSPELKAKALSLTSKLPDDESKIEALFYYVSKEIRYMGLTPEKDRPGFEPHDVKVTFEKKYGVCRDKAALLVRMLRIAGIESYPVLISVEAKKDPDVPVPYFDHAIVAVTRKGGGYELMDPTDEHARQILPYYDDDRSYLVCRPEGEILRTSPVRPQSGNMMRISAKASLSTSGELKAKAVLDFGGANDDAYRNVFARMKEDELRRFFEARLKEAQPGARLESIKLEPESMQDMSKPLRAEIEYAVEGLTASGSSVSVATIPWVGKSFGLINYLIGDAGLDARKYPMQTGVACGVDESLSIDLGEGYAGIASLPAEASEDNDALSYRQSFSAKGRELDCSRSFGLNTVELSPRQYLELKRTLRTMDNDERKSPLLALSPGAQKALPASASSAPPPLPESNARILDSRKELEVLDAHSSIYRVAYKKLILSYEGKVREAEVKIEYDPACESVKFLRGVSISKDGTRQEVSTSEINAMDAGWNASAKRYTGGKILVANIPGVEIGSTIDVAYEIETHDKPFLAGSEQFRSADGIDAKSFVLEAPAAARIESRVDGPAGGIAASDSSSGGRRTLSWSAKAVAPMPSERSTPPLWSFSPGVDYYVGDFSADLAALNAEMVRHAAGQARAAERARALVAACKTPEESIAAIRDFVAQTIRLAGPYFGDLPLRELSDADVTLTDCYGHEADRAILLYSMLSAAGFSPELVLASELPAIPRFANALRSFPSPDQFRRPLVRVASGGRRYYLNDTDQYARLGSTASEGRLGLRTASGEIEEIEAEEDCATSQRLESSISLSGDGKALVTVTTSYYGELYDANKRYFTELTPEERRRYFQGAVSGIAQGARPVGEPTTDFDAYPGVVRYEVAIDDFAVVEGDYLYFSLPYSPSLLKLDSDQRALPYFIKGRTRREANATIILPPGYASVEISPTGQSTKLPGGAGEISLTGKASPGERELRLDMEADPAVVEPKDYADLARIESALERRASWTFLLKRSK